METDGLKLVLGKKGLTTDQRNVNCIRGVTNLGIATESQILNLFPSQIGKPD